MYSGIARVIMSRKRQFNFRIDEELLEKVKQAAEIREMTISEWMEDACLIALGASEEDREASYRIFSIRDKDRVKEMEYEIEGLKKSLAENIYRMDQRIDAIWDSLEYVSSDIENQSVNMQEFRREFMKAIKRQIEDDEDFNPMLFQ